jgi:hypothetical protein
MILFRRSAAPPPPTPPAPTPLEQVITATARYEQARTERDRAIAGARNRAPLREIATASNLSVSRIKQIAPHHGSGWRTTRPPVGEMDLLGELGDGGEVSGERVMALLDADPFLPSWPSERAFIDADPHRSSVMDVQRNVHDLAEEEVWQVCYVQNTREVYAWTPREADPAYVDAEPSGLSASGPCYLLGHVITWDLVEAGIVLPGWNISHRPGGLAWVLGRVRLLNRATAALGEDYQLTIDGIRDYLQNLPPHERTS